MMSIEQYRSNADDCLRLAGKDRKKRGKELWTTLARSWLLLAQDAERINEHFSIVPAQEPASQDADDLAEMLRQ